MVIQYRLNITLHNITLFDMYTVLLVMLGLEAYSGLDLLWLGLDLPTVAGKNNEYRSITVKMCDTR